MFDKKYGRYKIYRKIKKSKLNDLFGLVKENTVIHNKGNGEVEFVLNNIDKLLEYEINNFTNINELTNYKYDIQELIGLKDDNIQKCIDILRDLLSKNLETYKNIIISKTEKIYKIQKEISEIESLS